MATRAERAPGSFTRIAWHELSEEGLRQLPFKFRIDLDKERFARLAWTSGVGHAIRETEVPAPRRTVERATVSRLGPGVVAPIVGRDSPRDHVRDPAPGRRPRTRGDARHHAGDVLRHDPRDGAARGARGRDVGVGERAAEQTRSRSSTRSCGSSGSNSTELGLPSPSKRAVAGHRAKVLRGLRDPGKDKGAVRPISLALDERTAARCSEIVGGKASRKAPSGSR